MDRERENAAQFDIDRPLWAAEWNTPGRNREAIDCWIRCWVELQQFWGSNSHLGETGGMLTGRKRCVRREKKKNENGVEKERKKEKDFIFIIDLGMVLYHRFDPRYMYVQYINLTSYPSFFSVPVLSIRVW